MITKEDANIAIVYMAKAGCTPPYGTDTAVLAGRWSAELPQHWEREHLRPAVQAWLAGDRGKEWPTPRDLVSSLAAVTTGRPASSEEAWLAVVRALSQYGWRRLQDERPSLLTSAADTIRVYECVRLLGGWQPLAMMEVGSPSMLGVRKSFVEVWEQVGRRQRDEELTQSPQMQRLLGDMRVAESRQVEQRDQRALTEQGMEAAQLVSRLAERLKVGGE